MCVAADSVLLRYCDFEDWPRRRYIIMDGRYPRTRRPEKRPTSRERAQRTVTVVTDGTYGNQLFKSHRFIPLKLREPNANLRPSYVRTSWAVVKGESPLKRAQKQLDPDPRWDLSFILWEIGIGSIKRKRNCDLWDLSWVSRKLGKPPDPCWDLSCALGKTGRDNPHWDLSCGLRKMGKPDLLRKNGTELKVLQPPGGGSSPAAKPISL